MRSLSPEWVITFCSVIDEMGGCHAGPAHWSVCPGASSTGHGPSVCLDRVLSSPLMPKIPPGQGEPNAMFRCPDSHRNCPHACSYAVVNVCCWCTIVRTVYKEVPLHLSLSFLAYRLKICLWKWVKRMSLLPLKGCGNWSHREKNWPELSSAGLCVLLC